MQKKSTDKRLKSDFFVNSTLKINTKTIHITEKGIIFTYCVELFPIYGDAQEALAVVLTAFRIAVLGLALRWGDVAWHAVDQPYAPIVRS
jgi:hypothetical protein